MKKIAMVVMLAIAAAGCGQDADVASHNLSKAADNFEIERKWQLTHDRISWWSWGLGIGFEFYRRRYFEFTWVIGPFHFTLWRDGGGS